MTTTTPKQIATINFAGVDPDSLPEPSRCHLCGADDTNLIQKKSGLIRCEDTAACLTATEHGTDAP